MCFIFFKKNTRITKDFDLYRPFYSVLLSRISYFYLFVKLIDYTNEIMCKFDSSTKSKLVLWKYMVFI